MLSMGGLMDIMEKMSAGIKDVESEMEKIIPRNGEPKEVYEPIWEFLDRGGKRIRPALYMLSCAAVGGNPKENVVIPSSIEFFHNFTLIHDDLEDDSKQRRGKPCTHIIYGMPLAINAGDGLFVYSMKAVANSKLKPKVQVKVSQVLADGFAKVLDGQGRELGWHTYKKWDITEDDYFKMVEGKTGSLIAVSCEAGGIVGGGKKKQLKALHDFGMAIGISFQIQDDILNIVGDSKKFKKTLREDITEGKRTLMVIRTLAKCKPEEKQIIIEALDTHTTDQEKNDAVVKLFEKYKAMEYADSVAKKIVEKAKKKLDKALPPSEAKSQLLELADFFIHREY